MSGPFGAAQPGGSRAYGILNAGWTKGRRGLATMATMRQIRSRIRVAKNIQQITKAMKMVAAARLRRAQDRVQAARPYAMSMREVVGRLSASSSDDIADMLLQQRDVAHVGILIISGDRGLCGSYNTAVLRLAQEVVAEHGAERVRLYMVGNRGATFLRRRMGCPMEQLALNPNDIRYGDAAQIADRLRRDFTEGLVDVVEIVYTEFGSAIAQRPRRLQLLPIAPDAAGDGTSDHPIFEPNPQVLASELLPRYLVTQVYSALLESIASEQGARMTSMTSATDNAGKMISSLTLSLNRARQAAITKELAEIVGGAEALKG